MYVWGVNSTTPTPNAGGASADADVGGIVIGSTWRRCSASRAVAESSLAVADYLLMMMIAFITFKSSLVPLLEGL